MGNSGPKVHGMMPEVDFQPYPYTYRCSMGKTVCRECRCGDFTEAQLNDPESGVPQPAGMILEVVQGKAA